MIQFKGLNGFFVVEGVSGIIFEPNWTMFLCSQEISHFQSKFLSSYVVEIRRDATIYFMMACSLFFTYAYFYHDVS